MTRSDTVLSANRSRLGLKWPEARHETEIATPDDGSVLRGLAWVAALYAAGSVAIFATWRIITN